MWLALAVVLALLRRRLGIFVLVLVGVGLADLFAELIKDATGRRRPPLVYREPPPLVPDPHSSSFPSGHAATSFAGATVLAFAFPRAAPGFYVLAAAIAFSRVYVGVHWPLDVIGGALLGGLVALSVVFVARRIRRPKKKRRS